MPLPKIEVRIIISTSTVIGTFAGVSVSMPAGRYYLTSGDSGTSFLATLKSQLDTATGRVWTVTLDDTNDTSVGTVFLITSGGATTATWSSTAIRDLLGFATNLAIGNSWTGTKQAQYLWLPNCGRTNPMGPEESDGAIEVDFSHAMSTDGTPCVLGYTPRYKDNLEFPFILGSKCKLALETLANESFESFYLKMIATGFRIRYHKDRSDDATYKTWTIADGGAFEPAAMNSNWVGAKSLWAIKYLVRKVP